uniref:Ribosomal protein S3 n=1 Tax=Pichia kluyveri TaxID=36015 RepID=S5U540_PICKL|nr:ribosomal protein S3 [Pichia kluyveri]AGS44206.1 ribosomal protein S3 [Pichia kluyveri]
MEIKNWLELINRSISKRINKEIILRKRLLLRINKLEKLNHINDYKLISYNYNKNGMILKSIISKLIIRLLENIINGVDLKKDGERVSKSGGSIIISKPVIKEKLNKVEVLFYYFLPNNKSYKNISRINMFINKIKDYKELVLLNKDYKKGSYILQEKEIVSNIINNIMSNRNNVKYINTNVKNIINNLSINEKENKKWMLLLKELLKKNIEEVGNLPKEVMINKTLWNVSKLIENEIKSNELKEMKRESQLLRILKRNNDTNILNIYNKVLDTNKLICGISNIHSKNELLLERKDLINNYLLKNEILLNKVSAPTPGAERKSNRNILKINNSKLNVNGYIVSYVDILLGKIINKGTSNNIKMIISKYFGLKEVEIKGINLKYEFNNPEILLKLIRKGISKRQRTLSRIFRFRLKNRIPLLNDKGVLKNKIANNLLKNMSLNNNILNVENNIKKELLLLNELNKSNNNISYINNDIKDYYNHLDMDNNLTLNNEILYKNIVGWSLLLKGKVGARKGKNRSNRILMTKGSFKNNNLYIYNIFDETSNNNGYSKDRLRLNYIKNSNIINYMDKSTNNGKLGITLKVNIL